MLTATKIPYLDKTWPITSGCSGEGCKAKCWARALANRYGQDFAPRFHPGRMGDPLRLKKPSAIGVSFTGDLFDEGIGDEQIRGVNAVAWTAKESGLGHRLIFLTKQSERLRKLGLDWPDNCWMGVSAEDGKSFNERVCDLSVVKATHRWISYEPAIGPLGVVSEWPDQEGAPCLLCGVIGTLRGRPCPDCLDGYVHGLDLIIMGGQSGADAGPMPVGWLDWARSVRDQCAAAGCAFTLKQGWGLHPEHRPALDGRVHWALPWAPAQPQSEGQ